MKILANTTAGAVQDLSQYRSRLQQMPEREFQDVCKYFESWFGEAVHGAGRAGRVDCIMKMTPVREPGGLLDFLEEVTSVTASAMTKALNRTVAGWWDDLSPEARKAYIKDHPNSKYAGKGGKAAPKKPDPTGIKDPKKSPSYQKALKEYNDSQKKGSKKSAAPTKKAAPAAKPVAKPAPSKHPKVKLSQGGFKGIKKLIEGAQKNMKVKSGYTDTKSGVGVSIHIDGGNRFDHSVPIKDRGPDKRAPMYYGLDVTVFTDGESHRQTMDGPIANSSNKFTWTKKFPKEPTKAELDAAQDELHQAIEDAKKVYKDTVNHFNK